MIFSLRSTGICIKFVTNTTKESKNTLYQRLVKIGFHLEKDEIFSSLSATNNYVCKNNLNPFYLVSDDARQDFPPTSERPLDSVVVGLASEAFNYEKLNEAFRVLLDNKTSQLIAIHQGKYYKRKDGIALGPGCFIKGLEYAASKDAKVIGKPNKYFFESAIPEGVTAEECVMIGDDVNDDITGALKNNIRGIQVKTGKYLPDVQGELSPTALVENFAEAVEWIKCNM